MHITGIAGVSPALFPLPLGGVRGGPRAKLPLEYLKAASTHRVPSRPVPVLNVNVDAPSKNNSCVYRRPSPNPSQREEKQCGRDARVSSKRRSAVYAHSLD